MSFACLFMSFASLDSFGQDWVGSLKSVMSFACLLSLEFSDFSTLPGKVRKTIMSFACLLRVRVSFGESLGKLGQFWTRLDSFGQVGQSLWELGIIWDPFGTIWDNW